MVQDAEKWSGRRRRNGVLALMVVALLATATAGVASAQQAALRQADQTIVRGTAQATKNYEKRLKRIAKLRSVQPLTRARAEALRKAWASFRDAWDDDLDRLLPLRPATAEGRAAKSCAVRAMRTIGPPILAGIRAYEAALKGRMRDYRRQLRLSREASSAVERLKSCPTRLATPAPTPTPTPTPAPSPTPPVSGPRVDVLDFLAVPKSWMETASFPITSIPATASAPDLGTLTGCGAGTAMVVRVDSSNVDIGDVRVDFLFGGTTVSTGGPVYPLAVGPGNGFAPIREANNDMTLDNGFWTVRFRLGTTTLEVASVTRAC